MFAAFGLLCNNATAVLVAGKQMSRIASEIEKAVQFVDPELTLPPQGRNRHSAVVLGTNMIIFGGYAGRRLADIQVLDLSTFFPPPLPQPKKDKTANSTTNGFFSPLL